MRAMAALVPSTRRYHACGRRYKPLDRRRYNTWRPCFRRRQRQLYACNAPKVGSEARSKARYSAAREKSPWSLLRRGTRGLAWLRWVGEIPGEESSSCQHLVAVCFQWCGLIRSVFCFTSCWHFLSSSPPSSNWSLCQTRTRCLKVFDGNSIMRQWEQPLRTCRRKAGR